MERPEPYEAKCDACTVTNTERVCNAVRHCNQASSFLRRDGHRWPHVGAALLALLEMIEELQRKVG